MTALPIRHTVAGAMLAVCLCLPAPSLHAQPDFGDNSSRWANDGECDDPRFEGEGSAATLLDGDRGHDATDCRSLFEPGTHRVARRRRRRRHAHSARPPTRRATAPFGPANTRTSTHSRAA